MSDTVCVVGMLVRGTPCWRLVVAPGEEWGLIGNLSAVREGEHVMACGSVAQASFCGMAKTLLVSWIGAKVEGKPAAPPVVQRRVAVQVTLSQRDLSPQFRLEAQPLSLTANGNRWVGVFEQVTVTGLLDLYFASGAWPDQEFVLDVVVDDPGSAVPPVQKQWRRTAGKGHVVFTETLDVGAA